MINLYFGPVINPQTLTHFDAVPQCLIAVGSDGNIIWIENGIEPSAVRDVITLRGLTDGEYTLVDYSTKSGEFIMPGLIDTHVHACQFPILGVGGEDELLDWLLNHVFPTERLFENEEYAKSVYEEVIHRSIASGTTTSCYYGSLHLSATIFLADITRRKGQRAFIGKCNMDWNCPGSYIERSAKESVDDTIKLIEHIQSLPFSSANEPLVHPIITPRFALSCSDELLRKLGELAASLPHVAIQTHVSENRKEVADAGRRFDTDSYPEIYERFGLLRHNTILGHGVWLTEKDMDLIAKRGAGVAHCPTSNFYLSSGMAKVGLLLDHGVKVGLGTDVSGGYNPSILYTIQMASNASKMVAVQAELDEETRRKWRHGKHDKRSKHHRHGEHGHHRHAHGRSESSSDSSSESDSGSGREVRANHHEHHRHHRYRERDANHHDHQEHVHEQDRRDDHHDHHCGDHHGHEYDRVQDDHRNHHCEDHHKHRFANKKLSVATLLYLATLGGAHVCCLQDRIGSFAVGKAFDALHVSLDDAVARNPAVWGRAAMHEGELKEARLRQLLERFLFGGDNRNVRRVFVQGVLVGGEDASESTSGKTDATWGGAIIVDNPDE